MNELLNTLVPALVILTLAFIGLGITILVKKGGKFPNTHIHGNRYLNARGIHCAESMDHEEQKKVKAKIDYNKLKFEAKK